MLGCFSRKVNQRFEVDVPERDSNGMGQTLKLGEVIGRGATGVVYAGVLMERGRARDVAVRTLQHEHERVRASSVPLAVEDSSLPI